MPGHRVCVRRVKRGILLGPMLIDINGMFAALDHFIDVAFVEEGRHQPRMAVGGNLFACIISSSQRLSYT